VLDGNSVMTVRGNSIAGATGHFEAGSKAEDELAEKPALARGAGGEAAGFADRYAAARPLEFEVSTDKLNHNVFRYPAKFHPPIARKLLELVTNEGQTVLDPFCGSGTLLVEAATLGRNSVGTDVDPLAVFVSRAKTELSDVAVIAAAAETCAAWLECRRSEDEVRWGAFTGDIEESDFEIGKAVLYAWIPDIPNMMHWFRRRVILQLADIRRYVVEHHEGEARRFLELCFASIIRNSSNADPVPVSGLEVTSHMLAKEAEGRAVDPWRLMSRALAKSLSATKAFIEARRPHSTAEVHQADARELDVAVTGQVAAVVTSPPYLTAVDYYRRHTLEMYWLGLTDQRSERLALMARYIGRDRVGGNHFAEKTADARLVADLWMTRFPDIKPERERAFRHYCDGMSRSLARMLDVVVPGGPIMIVAGDVRFCGVQVSMLELMKDLAGKRLVVSDHFWYPIVNRYMSYSRRNEANIAADHVLVFRGVDRG
jgi:SAM-dependent methyltransferase